MNIPLAKDIMTTDILAVDTGWSIQRLAEFFDEHNISGAPVTNAHGNLVGVVSLTDIVRQNSMPVKDPLAHEAHDYYIHSLQHSLVPQDMAAYEVNHELEITVQDILTPMIFDTNENTPVTEIANTMLNGHIHRLLVTHNKRIVGIITSLDLLKVIRDLPQLLAA